MATYTELLKQVTGLAGAAPTPEPEYPDYIKEMRKKFGVGTPVSLKALPASVRGRLEANLGALELYGPVAQGGDYRVNVPGSKKSSGMGGMGGGMSSGGGGLRSNKPWVSTTGSSFWDTGHSGYGDTGAPASGLPMSAHMVASPWLPTGSIINVRTKRGTVKAFVGDIGPGSPQYKDMIDLSVPLASKLFGMSHSTARTSAMGKMQFQVVSWGTGSVLYRNSSTYRRYRSMYGGLRKTSASQAYKETRGGLRASDYAWERAHR